ncbi:MAG: hypothetical protein K0V04_45300 [Deltaproteobacteria bacterium]|nr:hypothetical protein [Deltaproteobacteria bacterium]
MDRSFPVVAMLVAGVASGCTKLNAEYAETEVSGDTGGNATDVPTITSMTGSTSATTSPGTTVAGGTSGSSGVLDTGSSSAGAESADGGTGQPSPIAMCCAFGGDACIGLVDDTCVCGEEPQCCGSYDLVCLWPAIDPCGLPCPTNCCFPHPEPGCADPEVTDAVCFSPNGDPSCCNVSWTESCAFDAVNEHGACGAPQSCCSAQGNPGCDDPFVVAAVCAIDSFCCIVQWDESCVDRAATLGLC